MKQLYFFLLITLCIPLNIQAQQSTSSKSKKAELSKKKSPWVVWAAAITAAAAAVGSSLFAYKTYKEQEEQSVLHPKPKQIDAPVNDNLDTQLAVAARQGNVKLVRELIQKGADVNVGNRDGESPLVIAINAGHPEVAELLINTKLLNNTREQDIMVNLGDAHNNTPLILALKRGDYRTADLLMDKNANVILANDQGETALDMLRSRPEKEKDRPEVMELAQRIRTKTLR